MLNGVELISAAMSENIVLPESLVTKEKISEARTTLKRMVDCEISVKEAAEYFKVPEIIMLHAKIVLTETKPVE